MYRFIEHRCCPLRLRPPRCCRPTSSCAACVLLGIVATCCRTLGLRTPRHPPRGLRPSARGDDSRRLQEDPRLTRRREHCITRRRGLHPAVADRSRHEAAPPPTDAADFATNQASTAALLARGTEPPHISGHITESISEQRRIALSISRPMPTTVATPAPHSSPLTSPATVNERDSSGDVGRSAKQAGERQADKREVDLVLPQCCQLASCEDLNGAISVSA